MKRGEEGWPGRATKKCRAALLTAGSEPPGDSPSALTGRPEGDAGHRVRLRRLLLLLLLLRLAGRARRPARRERSHGG